MYNNNILYAVAESSGQKPHNSNVILNNNKPAINYYNIIYILHELTCYDSSDKNYIFINYINIISMYELTRIGAYVI